LAWLEGLRIGAAVLLLLYHAQLAFTGYAYTPQPTGLLNNVQQLLTPLDEFADLGLPWQWVSLPLWFGFQFVDVFVLISGFSLVLSLRNRPLQVGAFLKSRLLRILWPYWTVAWLSYPVLWAIGAATSSYSPHPWHIFAGATFPLVPDYEGRLLLHTSGPWWFLPLIVSFALLFPVLWKLLQRWGAVNLLLVSTGVTIAYRFLAVYQFEGHPTYVLLQTATDWQPFLLWLAKLSTFVVGMVVGQLYTQGKGPVFWPTRRALSFGAGLYTAGFVCQFDRLGWVLVDLLLPLGLTLCSMAVLRQLALSSWVSAAFTWLGRHSYSYFLVHNFVVDRTLKLVVQDDAGLYALLLPVMVLGTLLLALVMDGMMPLIRRILTGLLSDLDYVLSRVPVLPQAVWSPQVGDVVKYQGQDWWTVLKVERLLDEREIWLCQVTNGQRSLWINTEELEPPTLELPDSSLSDRDEPGDGRPDSQVPNPGTAAFHPRSGRS
jgi:peptidoglycan/LPS O-acetylase OafA/YrhL